MTTTLYLTANEQKWFDKFPESLKEGWAVAEETVHAYETEEDLKIRQRLTRFNTYPPTKKIIDQVNAGTPVEKVDLTGIPDEMFPTIMFTIGATGIAALMSVLLMQATKDEDIKALAQLSVIRHSLLEANASTPSA